MDGRDEISRSMSLNVFMSNYSCQRCKFVVLEGSPTGDYNAASGMKVVEPLLEWNTIFMDVIIDSIPYQYA